MGVVRQQRNFFTYRRKVLRNFMEPIYQNLVDPKNGKTASNKPLFTHFNKIIELLIYLR